MRILLSIHVFFLSIMSFFVDVTHASFIGEDPGLNFYSKIDEGNYQILQKTIVRRLEDTPTLDAFVRGCTQAAELLQWIVTSPDILDKVQGQNYDEFYKKLVDNIKSSKKYSSLSTDLFQEITSCLNTNYDRIKEESVRENDARITISYLGLYMDGDKSNSEYDIISDIEKINSVLFSKSIVYDGKANVSRKSLAEYFANKPIPPLFPDISLSGTQNNQIPDSDGDGIPDDIDTTDTDVWDLLWGVCTSDMSSPVSLEDLLDSTFTQELESVRSGNAADQSLGRGFSPVSSDPRGSKQPSPTSDSDFFHTLPCSGIFCIKTSFIPGWSIKLGGGKNISIEGIIDDYSKHILPISESALGCEIMTNNFGSFPKKHLNLLETMAGAKPLLWNKAQVSRRDKNEMTPDREKEELMNVMKCAYSAAGMSTDFARSRSIGGGGFMPIGWATTESAQNRRSPLGPQETPESARFSNCVEIHMQSARGTYYDSFSTDLTELQSYTTSMLREITDIINTLDALNSIGYCRQ